MHALTIDNILKSFGGTDVLKGIDIAIKPGQFLILVGPSGCGKSTLLNIIAGLETPSSGQIHIGGRDVTDLSPKDRDIAMVFQSYALYPNMTVRKNISFGLEIRKISKEKRAEIVHRVAAMLQIEELLDRKPSQLSGGQRQRVAMGRALARDPTLFLFDEPLSNLDAKLRVEMRAEIKELHRRIKSTIVYVTHDQIEAMTLGDLVAVMKDGVVQQFGTPQSVYNAPKNMFVAGFLGSPAMNFIPATIKQESAGIGAYLDSGIERIFLPLKHIEKALLPWLNKKVVLGIRPEHISNLSANQGDIPHGSCQLDSLEITGPDALITTRLNNTKVVSRVHPSSVCQPGEAMPLSFDSALSVVFDPATELSIC